MDLQDQVSMIQRKLTVNLDCPWCRSRRTPKTIFNLVSHSHPCFLELLIKNLSKIYGDSLKADP